MESQDINGIILEKVNEIIRAKGLTPDKENELRKKALNVIGLAFGGKNTARDVNRIKSAIEEE